jgi:molybdate transport system ATP-binding protein
MRMMTTPLITVDAITVRLRDRWLLQGTSWQINVGEQWAVTGPNGAGKTTLVKAIAGLLPVVKGTIRYHFLDGTAPGAAIAYVASDARREWWRLEQRRNHARGFAGRHHEHTSVRQLITPPNDHSCWSSHDASGWVDIVGRFQLESLLDKPALAISTGEMSRVLIARELVRRPQLLILDEPFDGLDRPGRRDLKKLLDGLADDGLPMVLVTHRPEELLAGTTHLMTIDDGQIISAGPIGYLQKTGMAGETAGAPVRSGSRPTPLKAPLTSEPLIEMQAVTVRYGQTTVLDRLSWRVDAGQHWAITGPNGAGKSTILNLITGDCLQVYANRIRLFGKRRGAGQHLWDVKARLGVVSHDLASAYQKPLSAMQVVCSGFFDSVGLYRHCDMEQRQIAAGWLTRLGMASFGQVVFNRLSQGQRQMILIARAMVKSPRLLILDEPCAGLDPHNRRTVLNLVDQIGRRGQTGLIFVSHHENEIPTCTTHRLMVAQGKATCREISASR